MLKTSFYWSWSWKALLNEVKDRVCWVFGSVGFHIICKTGPPPIPPVSLPPPKRTCSSPTTRGMHWRSRPDSPKRCFHGRSSGCHAPCGNRSHAFLQQICFWKTSGYHVKAKVSKSRSSLKCKMMPVGRRGPVIWYSKTMWRARRDAVTPTPQPPARPTAM